MDIRFINKKDEIINASRLSIKVMGSHLIGINERQEIIVIEEYENEEKARESMKQIIDGVIKANEEEYEGIVIRT